jgi:predicted peptidase
VLVFLHGAGECAPADLRAAMTAHGPLRAGSAAAATQKFLVVAPQLPAPGGDEWRGRAKAVREIARMAAAQYGGNPAKTYLTGFSYGANGVLDLGFRHLEVWAALWAVDPTRLPAGTTPRPIWVSAGEHSRNNRATFAARLGVQDRARGALPPQDRVYHDAGLDHVATATEAYADDEIYEWLLARSRP